MPVYQESISQVTPSDQSVQQQGDLLQPYVVPINHPESVVYCPICAAEGISGAAPALPPPMPVEHHESPIPTVQEDNNRILKYQSYSSAARESSGEESGWEYDSEASDKEHRKTKWDKHHRTSTRRQKDAQSETQPVPSEPVATSPIQPNRGSVMVKFCRKPGPSTVFERLR